MTLDSPIDLDSYAGLFTDVRMTGHSDDGTLPNSIISVRFLHLICPFVVFVFSTQYTTSLMIWFYCIFHYLNCKSGHYFILYVISNL